MALWLEQNEKAIAVTLIFLSQNIQTRKQVLSILEIVWALVLQLTLKIKKK